MHILTPGSAALISTDGAYIAGGGLLLATLASVAAPQRPPVEIRELRQ